MKVESSTQLKITVIGEYFVGKTSVIGRFVDGTFDDTYSATIGFTFLSKKVKFNNKDYVLNIWDTSGSERHRAVAPNYYRGSDGCILVYDLSNPKSLEPLEYWLKEFRNLSSVAGFSESVPSILIGNKADLPFDPSTQSEAESFAQKNGIEKHLITSALTGLNVDEAFQSLVEICSTHQIQQFQQVSLSLSPPSKKKNCC